MGDSEIRPSHTFELSDHAIELLENERDLEVADLRRRAAELESLTPIAYLGRGLHLHDVRNLELAGRLSKSEYQIVEYMWGKPGWRVLSGSSEFYVQTDRIAAIFGPAEQITAGRR